MIGSPEQETILLIDDDEAHRTMLKVNLMAEGFIVDELSDGDEVLPHLKEQEADLILLDMKMVRMDGLTTLSVLLQAGYDIPGVY